MEKRKDGFFGVDRTRHKQIEFISASRPLGFLRQFKVFKAEYNGVKGRIKGWSAR